MRFLISLLLLAGLYTTAQSQNSLNIRVKIDGLSTDTIWFGQTYGKRAVPLIAAKKDAEGWATLTDNNPMPDGLYAIIFKRGVNARNTYISVFVSAKEHEFSLETQIDKPYKLAKFTDAPTNQAYFEYYHETMTMLQTRDSLNERYRLYQSEATFNDLITQENSIAEYQQAFIQNQKGSPIAKLIEPSILPKQNLSIQWPQSEIERRRVLVNQLENRLGSDDFATNMRFPQWIERMDINTFKLWNNPDSARQNAERTLSVMKRDSTAYQYYFNYMVNSFGSMSRYSLDEVFIFLVNNYVRKNLAPWTGPEEKTKMTKQAQESEPLMTGKRAPNAKLTDRFGQSIELDSINAAYTLLVFWDPTCGHCKKELPLLGEMWPKYKEKGLKIVTFCAPGQDQTPESCWNTADELKLPSDWLYLNDPTGAARIRSLYNLRTFPRLYLVDKNKKILYRRSGEVTEEELMLYFDRLLK